MNVWLHTNYSAHIGTYNSMLEQMLDDYSRAIFALRGTNEQDCYCGVISLRFLLMFVLSVMTPKKR